MGRLSDTGDGGMTEEQRHDWPLFEARDFPAASSARVAADQVR